jgi:hypothetical protein
MDYNVEGWPSLNVFVACELICYLKASCLFKIHFVIILLTYVYPSGQYCAQDAPPVVLCVLILSLMRVFMWCKLSDLGRLVVDVSRSCTHARTQPTQHTTQETNIHALSGIQTRDTSSQAASDLRFRPHGHRHRPFYAFTALCRHRNDILWNDHVMKLIVRGKSDITKF